MVVVTVARREKDYFSFQIHSELSTGCHEVHVEVIETRSTLRFDLIWFDLIWFDLIGLRLCVAATVCFPNFVHGIVVFIIHWREIINNLQIYQPSQSQPRNEMEKAQKNPVFRKNIMTKIQIACGHGSVAGKVRTTAKHEKMLRNLKTVKNN